MAEENITIRIQAIDEATGKIEQVSQSISKLQSTQSSLKGLKLDIPKIDTTQLEKLKETLKGFGFDKFKINMKEMGSASADSFTNLGDALKTAGMSMQQWNLYAKQNFLVNKEGIGITNTLTGATDSYGVAVQNMVTKTRRFKMEWLSVMFTGMALNRVFGGIVNKQLELWGISQGLDSMWTVLMADVMEPLTQMIWDMIDAIMDLPPETKMVIGLTIVGLDALGTIFTWVGMFYLAVQGIKGAWLALFGTTLFAGITEAGGLFAWLGVKIAALGISTTPFLAALLAIGLIIAGLALIVSGVYLIIKNKFEGIGLVIMGIGVILLLFIGWWALIPIAVGLAVYLVIKYWSSIKAFFVKLWADILIIFTTVWNAIANFFKGIINTIISYINALISGFEGMLNFAIKGINALIKLINKIPGVNIGTIGEIRLGRIPSLQEGGFIQKEGLAYLHAGETVTPKGGGGMVFSPNTTINATVSSSYDVRKLADELNSYWASDFQRLMRSRGSI